MKFLHAVSNPMLGWGFGQTLKGRLAYEYHVSVQPYSSPEKEVLINPQLRDRIEQETWLMDRLKRELQRLIYNS